MTLASRLAEQVERDWLTETLAALVRIPSVTGEEDAAQEWMAETLKDLGGDVDAWRVDAEALKGRPGFPGARILTPRQNVVATFAGTDVGPTVEWVGGVWQGTETSAAHPLVETLKRAVGEVVGRPPVVRGATYGSDLRLFTNDFGIPGVLFGPGDIRQAHFTDESVPIAEVEFAARALARTIVEYCGVA